MDHFQMTGTTKRKAMRYNELGKPQPLKIAALSREEKAMMKAVLAIAIQAMADAGLPLSDVGTR